MLNLIKNPNINSTYLFRADISLEKQAIDGEPFQAQIAPRLTSINGYNLRTILVRTMIPRNTLIDKPLDQTCLFHECVMDSGEVRTLVTYLPHVSSAAELPFYHPAVRAIGFLHKFNPDTKEGNISIHYSFFETEPRSAKLERTAQHLLATAYKHGTGCAAGYVKRVNHDVVVPQAAVQDTYSRLKVKYARTLCGSWVESTDPTKHVFEDLGIAAFLIELWAEMYKDAEFPGFVDIGCGNGLLVHILLGEGYSGWGFDARRRKSWAIHSPLAQANLKELVLIPAILQKSTSNTGSETIDSCTAKVHAAASAQTHETTQRTMMRESQESDLNDNKIIKATNQQISPEITNGTFPTGTFIISNHADELTPWTPILANLSQCPFMMIPCCSHHLSGSKFRAPPPKGPKVSGSTYASYVAWVSNIAEECGWVVEKEMLRIPSTRNAALIGRRRAKALSDVDTSQLLASYGGARCWEENAMKLVRNAVRGH
jgi:tRNASer (uridine44-2'-O)-methyltransferase